MTSSAFGVDLLPHRPPMRLVEEVADLVAGESARGLRRRAAGGLVFSGTLSRRPGGACDRAHRAARADRRAGGGERLTNRVSHQGASCASRRLDRSSSRPARGRNQTLDAHARVIGRIGGMIKIEGEVLADGVRVAVGSVALAEVSAVATGVPRSKESGSRRMRRMVILGILLAFVVPEGLNARPKTLTVALKWNPNEKQVIPVFEITGGIHKLSNRRDCRQTRQGRSDWSEHRRKGPCSRHHCLGYCGLRARTRCRTAQGDWVGHPECRQRRPSSAMRTDRVLGSRRASATSALFVSKSQ